MCDAVQEWLEASLKLEMAQRAFEEVSRKWDAKFAKRGTAWSEEDFSLKETLLEDARKAGRELTSALDAEEAARRLAQQTDRLAWLQAQAALAEQKAREYVASIQVMAPVGAIFQAKVLAWKANAYHSQALAYAHPSEYSSDSVLDTKLYEDILKNCHL